MNNLTPEQLAFRAGYEQGRFDAQMEAAQQRHISYVCPQCHWSLDKQTAPAQEHVAWTLLLVGEHHGLVGKAGEKFVGHPEYYERVDVFKSPPASKPWVGLTDEEVEDVYRIVRPDVMKFWRICEAKLKEKNI